ncbi:TPA: DUF882 domain-containing protein [Neisseria gonorrhoeae]
MNRRDFLKLSAKAAALASSGGLLLLPEIVLADDSRFWKRSRVLSIYRPASRERKNIKFFADGQYIQEGYKALCWMMRDVVDNHQMHAININLINLLFAQQQYLRDLGRPNPELVLHSGFRTRRHNDSLEGATKNSQHLSGNAGDFHIERASLSELAALARRFRVGGIGIYSTFIHNDIGVYREWRK